MFCVRIVCSIQGTRSQELNLNFSWPAIPHNNGTVGRLAINFLMNSWFVTPYCATSVHA